jgi:hypothetical protein
MLAVQCLSPMNMVDMAHSYLLFSLYFFLIHMGCYIVAGLIDLRFSKRIYGGKDRLYKGFFRDMSDEKEGWRVSKYLIPSQFLRAVLMSVVLYPVLPFIEDLTFWEQFFFMGGLMFVYADFSSAVPFSNTIEGWVYLRKEFVKRDVFWTIQLEAILYSLMFGAFSAWLLI